MDSSQFVALDPALVCHDVVLGRGAVHALSSDAVMVSFRASPLPLDTASGTLSVTFGEEHQFALRWQGVQKTSDDGRMRVSIVSADRVHLADLMTLVRKNQHINICASQDVEASDRYTGLEEITLLPCALPELDWSELDTSTWFLGHRFKLPLLVTGMTGGLARGADINLRLARAAAACGIPMGVGSQRVALDNPDHAAIFTVKKTVPDLFLIGNIGIAQLLSADAVSLCQRAVEMIEADALAIHVNVLQEVIQVEGDRNFRGVLAKIAAVARALSVPLLIKEVGVGLDPITAQRLIEAGVAALDCGGKGGTSWSLIEGERASSPVTRAVARTYRDFGIPTAVSLAAIRAALPHVSLAATGGVRDGLMVAKACALGANVCGIGLPLLRAALLSEQAVHEELTTFAQGLRIAMIATGATSLSDLARRAHRSEQFFTLVDRYTATEPVSRSTPRY
ncbi:MAG: type 2 isopentenyl-diphosphate Delta-isomerase [Deltaproteobacteria bacterium]|nr:type 2 isopentenyl-diphosphate Delta-isomerase [Deltaproteobacteria bacterium]